MNAKKYKSIFYIITATILATIVVQFYWNYKNYQENEQLISNEIQRSLDNAIEEYFADIAKDNFTRIVNLEDKKETPFFIENINFDSILNENIDIRNTRFILRKEEAKTNFKISSISINSDDKINQEKLDSIFTGISKEINRNKTIDSLQLTKNVKAVIFSITSNQIQYTQLDSLIESQLQKSNIPIRYVFNHLKNDSIFYTSKESLQSKNALKSISSKSTYLKNNEQFKLYYNNISFETLKRSSSGILLSLLLSLLIVSCLFYLLKIIKQQKALTEIKNDLISNITHEFKTPIATISTAIEAIENFNIIDDKEKAKKYLSMSSVQLQKLNLMVEKLLETATLDSEQLILKKESVDIVKLTKKIVGKHQFLAAEREIIFSSKRDTLFLMIDVFHFENVISNIIDNAIKYGGDPIKIHINSILTSIEILISDTGDGIEKNQQEKIFDKFYRVPKGNTHTVKGFGIGLYYCKKIIEKQGGNIQVSSTKNNTIFKISLPNE